MADKKYKFNEDYYAKMKLSFTDKILRQITDLSHMVKFNQYIDETERLTCIHDSYIKLTKKSEEGLLDLSKEYETYKNYMFISIKNEIFHLLTHKNANKIKREIYEHNLGIIDKHIYENSIEQIENDIDTKMIFEQFLANIKNEQTRYIITQYIKGFMPREIALELNMTEAAVEARIYHTKKQTNKNYKQNSNKKSQIPKDSYTNFSEYQKLWRLANKEKCNSYARNWMRRNKTKKKQK